MRRLVLALAFTVPAAVLAQTVDHPLQVGGDVKPPILIYQDDPANTSAVLKQRTATPIVALIVDENGIARDVHLLHSSGSRKFDRATLKAVRNYRFRPATLHGKPVAVRLNVETFVDAF